MSSAHTKEVPTDEAEETVATIDATQTKKQKNTKKKFKSTLNVPEAKADTEGTVPPSPLPQTDPVFAFNADIAATPSAETAAAAVDFADNLGSPPKTPLSTGTDVNPLISVASSSPTTCAPYVANPTVALEPCTTVTEPLCGDTETFAVGEPVTFAPCTGIHSVKPSSSHVTIIPSLTNELNATVQGTLVNPRVANAFLASLFDLSTSPDDLAVLKADYLQAQDIIFERMLTHIRSVRADALLKKKTHEINRARDDTKKQFSEHILPSFLNQITQ